MDALTIKALEFDQIRTFLQGLAETGYARRKLESLSPLSSVSEVEEELQRVEEMRTIQRESSGFPAGGVVDLEPILLRIRAEGSRLDGEELWGIVLNLRVHLQVRKVIDRLRSQIPLLYRLSSSLTPLPQLEEVLVRAINPDGTIRESASPQLARIRHHIAEVEETIRQRIAGIVSKWSRVGILREPTFTIREGRYVLPVRSDAMGKVKGIIHDRSATGGTLFVEPAALIELGNELRTLQLAERDEVERILREMTARVREHLPTLEENHRVMGELDLRWAKASLAERLEAVKPIVQEKIPLRLVGCRHPLLVLNSGRPVVPLDLELGEQYSTLVISGPNAGGKTVALKTVGLMSLMALSGIPIPGKPGCQIPFLRKIIADVGDQQSLLNDLSTFTARIQRMREIISQADNESLVLIDEIGAGTDPHEGSALSIAFLEELTQKGILTIVTTHQSNLKAFAQSTPRCANGSMAFDPVSLQPTFQFLPHIPGSSFALDIARRHGLPERLVNRARELMGENATRWEDLTLSLSQQIARYQQSEAELARLKERLEREQHELEERLSRLRLQEKTYRREMEAELKSLLKEARSIIEQTVREIREENASRESILKAQDKLRHLSHTVSQKSNIPLIEVPPPTPLQPPFQPLPERDPSVGDWVSVDEGVVGQVKAMTAKGDRVLVAVGSVQMWVRRERVKVVEPPQASIRPSRIVELPQVPFQLDVRGLDPPEAINRVDRYLSDSYAAGRSQVGIIHGKGRGVLARHIHQFLRSHSLVSRFRFGEYGEGEYGVTLVELKEP